MLLLLTSSLASDHASAPGILLVTGLALVAFGSLIFRAGYRSGKRAAARAARSSIFEEVSKAREETQLKSRLLANVSHELRTPLHAIRGFTHLLREAGDLNREQRDYLKSIDVSGENLLRLIHDLLDFCQVENRRLSFRSDAFFLHEIIPQVVDLVRAARTGPVPILLYPPSPPVPALLGDPLRLQQILTNVIGNAAKFTTAGVIRIRWHGEKRGDYWRLKISVEDTGPGIPPAELASLFQPFARGAASRTHAVAGSGLGLCISRELARMMAGDVTVESVCGSGTTVSITVELTPAAIAPLTTPGRPSQATRFAFAARGFSWPKTIP